MIMIYYPYDWKCEFYSDKHNRVTIEDKDVFEKFLVDLDSCIQSGEESFYMEDDEKQIKIEKSVAVISSPLDLKFTKKDYQKVLFNKLIEELQVNGLDNQLAECYAGVVENIDSLSASVPYNIEFDEELDYSAIFKLLDIRIEQPKGNFSEKMLDFLDGAVKLLNKKVFFFVNCHSYIDKKWYDEIVKWGEYQNVIIVFVENKQIQNNKSINEYILDQDMCEIH
ncbi:MAG: type II-A CRISPR-associated protein Csn2 [Eubacterium sp.]|nr:type II-A CRISPR-associated protein Csn2 [Eubacterium sp.]